MGEQGSRVRRMLMFTADVLSAVVVAAVVAWPIIRGDYLLMLIVRIFFVLLIVHLLLKSLYRSIVALIDDLM